MRLCSVFFALFAFAVVTGPSAFAQSAHGTPSDNYLQTQSAPIGRAAPSPSSDSRIGSASVGPAPDPTQSSPDNDQDYADQGSGYCDDQAAQASAPSSVAPPAGYHAVAPPVDYGPPILTTPKDIPTASAEASVITVSMVIEAAMDTVVTTPLEAVVAQVSMAVVVSMVANMAAAVVSSGSRCGDLQRPHCQGRCRLR